MTRLSCLLTPCVMEQLPITNTKYELFQLLSIFKDSVPNAVKQRRLREVIDTFYQVGNEKVKREKNAIQLVLVESHSKQSKPDSIQYLGKNDGGRNCVLNSM